jgi:hypothetical protein
VRQLPTFSEDAPKMSETYIEATDEAAVRLFSSGIQGEINMLNLLRFRDVADYTDFPELMPADNVSGREAYQKYIDHTLPFLTATGGSISLIGEGGNFFVGPPDEVWDVAMLIKQNSLADFLSFATNQDYLRGVGHRSAALLDSRILPIRPYPGSDITIS